MLPCHAMQAGPGEFLQTGDKTSPWCHPPLQQARDRAHRDRRSEMDLAELQRATKGKQGWGKTVPKKCPRLFPAAGMMQSRQPFGYCRTGWALVVSLLQGISFAAGFGACQPPCVPGQDSSSADGCPGVPRELPCVQGTHPPPHHLSLFPQQSPLNKSSTYIDDSSS